MREAIRSLALGKFDVVLFTSSVRVHHAFRFADEMGEHPEVTAGFRRAPWSGRSAVTSKTLREYEITPDLEPSHPKMEFLVKETAERSRELREHKII